MRGLETKSNNDGTYWLFCCYSMALHNNPLLHNNPGGCTKTSTLQSAPQKHQCRRTEKGEHSSDGQPQWDSRQAKGVVR